MTELSKGDRSLIEMVDQIGRADAEKLGWVGAAVVRRYAELYPDEEAVFLTLPKHDLGERQRIIEALVDIYSVVMPLPTFAKGKEKKDSLG